MISDYPHKIQFLRFTLRMTTTLTKELMLCVCNARIKHYWLDRTDGGRLEVLLLIFNF